MENHRNGLVRLKLNTMSVQKILIIAILFYVNFAQYKLVQNSLILAALGGLSIGIYALGVVTSGKLRLNKYSYYYICFMIYMAIPTLLRGMLSQYITCLEYTLLMLSIINISYTENDIDWLTKAKLIMTLLTCAVFLYRPAVFYDKVNTVQYTLVTTLNPNTFGLDIVFGLWCALELFSQKKIKIYTFLISVGIFTISIIRTASRKSLICIAIALLLWVVLYYIRPQKISTSKLAKRLLLIAILVFGGYLVARKYFAGSMMERRILSMISGSDGSVSGRFEMYLNGFHDLMKHPLLGYGFGGYRVMYGRYSHATLVEVPVSGGIIGGLAYFIILIGDFAGTIRRARYFKKQNLYEHILIEHYMAIILWVMMLFLCVCVIHPYLFNSHVMLAILFSISMKYENRYKQSRDILV